MKTSEYIASGILEVYVLGELPPNEASEVETMASRHSEVRREISRIEEAFETLAAQLPVAPRPSLRDEILNGLAPVSSETTSSAGTSPNAAQPDAAQPDAAQPSVAQPDAAQPSAAQPNAVQPTESKPDPRNESKMPTSTAARFDKKSAGKQRNLLPFQLGIAASLLVTLLSVAAALYFRSQWQETEQELEETLAQNQEIASQYETASQRTQRLENDLSVVASSDYQPIALSGTDVSPTSSARVYWNQTVGQVYLNPRGLPIPPSNKQYQLWAIVDGSPVSAGVFEVTDDEGVSLQTMGSSITDASAFAITLEPRGGSESPTMEEMYVQGAVSDS